MWYVPKYDGGNKGQYSRNDHEPVVIVSDNNYCT